MRTAIKLADERGLESVSTRALAARLGSGPTSMYWHVPHRADLHELMFDEVIGEIPLPSFPSGNWRADITMLARGWLEACARHPWVSQLGIQPGIGPHTRRYGEFAFDVLHREGVPTEKAIEAVAIVNNYVVGFAERRSAWEQLKQRAGLEGKWEDHLAQYLADAQARDAELAEYVKTRIQLTSDANFDFGLECVLDGIAARLSVRGSSLKAGHR